MYLKLRTLITPNLAHDKLYVRGFSGLRLLPRLDVIKTPEVCRAKKIKVVNME